MPLEDSKETIYTRKEISIFLYPAFSNFQLRTLSSKESKGGEGGNFTGLIGRIWEVGWDQTSNKVLVAFHYHLIINLGLCITSIHNFSYVCVVYGKQRPVSVGLARVEPPYPLHTLYPKIFTKRYPVHQAITPRIILM